MAKVLGKLNPRTVAGALPPGRHSDGGNLYLLAEKSGAKRWLFIYRWKGSQREMGFGSLADVPLARAREKAAAARGLLADEIDPLAMKQAAQATPSFGEFADSVVAALMPGLSNAKHQAQWAMTLRTYAEPLRGKRIDKITTQDVLEVLNPIWTRIPETADRTRQRIERILDAAAAQGFRNPSHLNPACWRGNLKHLLPARQKLSRGHHPAMPYEAVGAFVQALRAVESMSSLALEFTILTACRSGEVLGARWREIDLEAAVWTIPAHRMKAKRLHRVSLSKRAIEILLRVKAFGVADMVFAARSKSGQLSNMAMTMLIRGMSSHFITVNNERRPCTAHGFRSSFRDWAGNISSHPRELAEEALAHQIGNQVERAYRRGDALAKRAIMMQDWCDYLAPTQTDLAGSDLSEEIKAA